MHDQSKITAFTFLRANGWSLAKISQELNVSKTTLWDWDNKRQDEIHFFKHLQLEQLQEKFIPSYEEELAQLRSLLNRIDAALNEQDFTRMSPQFLLQLSLQLRNRLGKMREQVPLRTMPPNTPLEPIPLTGCISRRNADQVRAELRRGEPRDAAPAATPPAPEPPPSEPATGKDSVIVPFVPAPNGHNAHHPEPLPNSASSCRFPETKTERFRTKRVGGQKSDR